MAVSGAETLEQSTDAPSTCCKGTTFFEVVVNNCTRRYQGSELGGACGHFRRRLTNSLCGVTAFMNTRERSSKHVTLD